MAGHGSHVAVVGAGGVGASICFALLTRGVASRVSLYDIDGPRAESEVADLSHGLEFVPSATVTGGADLELCGGADVVVVTAGAKQKPGQSRMELAAANAAMCRSLVPDLLAVAPDALLLMVTNPVDVVTSVAAQVAAQVADLAPGRVFGTGTVLDTSRFRYVLGRRCGVAVQNVHAYIVGEHGDSELALWSTATIGGIPVAEWRGVDGAPLSASERDDLVDEVRTAAQSIIAGKGATTWAIALATARVLEAILRDECRVLPVSAPLADLLGDPLPDGAGGSVSLSLPRIVGRDGCGPVLPTPVDDRERAALAASARQIADALDAVAGDA